MISRRIRNRRLQDTSIELVEVRWEFTLDQFDTFKTFFDETIDNGALPFAIEFDGVTTEVAFLENYTFAESNNLFSVQTTLEVISEET